MEKQFKRSLFIFRRDLRLEDNTGLNAALASSELVLCAFFFDPRQVQPHAYRSDRGFAFMLRALLEVRDLLRERGSQLYFFAANPETYLPTLIRQHAIQAVFFNRDYTPFSCARDRALYELGQGFGIEVHRFADCLLHEPEAVLSEKGSPYTVFTPYFRRWQSVGPRSVRHLQDGQFFKEEIAGAFVDPEPALRSVGLQVAPRAEGGRSEATGIVAALSATQDYGAQRDFPALAATSGLSAHLKFGTVSAREVYRTVCTLFGRSHGIVAQLAWRDFFHQIGFHFPHVFRGPFKQEYSTLAWREDTEGLERWCQGCTGFPIVDAGMRQLNATGYMHNRVRMIVASFLTKDLLLDWRHGERYFATRLTDYDPCVNNGNWQWAASTGCDAQPYFRVFNPWLQQQKFDREAIYVKQWVPELRHVPAEILHSSERMSELNLAAYPAPLLDHRIARLRAQDVFKALRGA